MSTRCSLARVVVWLSPFVVAACGARTGLEAPDESTSAAPQADAGADVRPDDSGAAIDSGTAIDSGAAIDSGVVGDSVVSIDRDSGVVVDSGAADTSVTDPLCRVPDAGPPSDGGTCTRTLGVGALDLSSSTCWVDSAVSEGETGTLVYDCGGGTASATFGSRTFVGSFDGDVLDLCIGTAFDWGDGCHWHSAQHLVGSLSSGKLSFGYAEAPDPGQTGCASSCSASATVTVE